MLENSLADFDVQQIQKFIYGTIFLFFTIYL